MPRKSSGNTLITIIFFPFLLLFFGILYAFMTYPIISSVILVVVIILIILIIAKIQEKKKEEERFEQNALLHFDADNLDELDGGDFENMLKVVFLRLGYKTQQTPYSNDFGVDLILIKDGNKIAIQAKRYAKNVGNRAVQEVYSGVKHYGADEGWIVTNSYFTRQAQKLAQSTDIKLIDRDKLLDKIKQAFAVCHKCNHRNKIGVKTCVNCNNPFNKNF